MRCITLTQPWAALVAIGAKRIETRSWKTAYTGPLAIHAARTFPKWARECCEMEPFKTALADWQMESLPLGKVVATVTLMGCRRTEDIFHQVTDQERKFGDYSENRYGWFLSDPVMLHEPVPAKGALGLWEWIR